MITIQQSQSVASIEAHYLRLKSGIERQSSGEIATGLDLMLPTNLRNWQLGGRATLIQFIVTWARHKRQGALITHVQGKADAARNMEAFCDEIHGLIAVLVAGEILAKDKHVSLEAVALECAQKRLVTTFGNPLGIRRGSTICFLCADETSWAYPPALYHQRPNAIKGREDFINLATSVLQAICDNYRSRVNTFSQSFQDNIGNILRELFANTDEWAKADCNDVPAPKSIRGILFDTHLQPNNRAVNLLKSAAGSKPLEEYLKHAEFQRHAIEGAFIEISVFDSGPGLASRWLRREIEDQDPVEEEFWSVMSCLQLHGTSSKESQKGAGLDAVMLALSKERGFVRLRTGRLNLFRNFAKDPFNGTTVPSNGMPPTFLYDWYTNTFELSPQPQVVGTLLTMLIPLSFR